MLICAAAFLLAPKHPIVLFAFLFTIPLHLVFKGFTIGLLQYEGLFPEMNYFVRAMCVILLAFTIVLVGSTAEIRTKWKAALGVLIAIVGLTAIMKYYYPNMGSDVKAMWLILGTTTFLGLGFRRQWTKWKDLVQYDSKIISQTGLALLASLVLLHIIFH